jgi:hypothetical protein
MRTTLALDDMHRVQQMIFDLAKEARSKRYLNRRTVDAYLDAIGLYRKAWERNARGDVKGKKKIIDSAQRKLAHVESLLLVQREQDDFNSGSQDDYRRAGLALTIAALLVFICGAFLQSTNWMTHESTVMSFGILVFMVGATLITWHTGVQRRYISFMWIAGFIIIGTLNGVSVIGTVIRP